MLHSLRLRTKFLLSFLAVAICLTGSTLLVVQHHVEKRIRETIRTHLSDSVRTYQSFAGQRETVMAASSAQLANLPNVRALMSTKDPSTIQEETASLLALSRSDLIVLADRTGNLEGLDSTRKAISRNQATNLLKMSLERGEEHGWWSSGGSLYEVWLHPIYFGAQGRDTVVGILVLGHELNEAAALSFARIVSGEIAFRGGDRIVVATLPLSENDARELLRQDGNAAQESRELRIGDERFLATTVILATGDVPVSMSILQSLDKATEFLRGLNRILLALGLVGVVIAGVLVFVLSRTFTRPLERLLLGARALEQGNYAYEVTPTAGDEVGEVTIAFERMRRSLQSTQAEQKQLEERLRQAHKMEAVGRLAGGVAHDFNNLLTVIRGNTDLLAEQAGVDRRQQKYIEQIQKAGDRAVSMTRQLLAFSRMQVLQPKVLDLNTVISEMNKIIPRLIGEHIEFEFEAGAGLSPVLADRGQLEQVFMNLAVNARDAMPDGGTLRVQTGKMVMDEAEARTKPPMRAGEYVVLRVSDTGQGMNAETKARIFEPFFTTKEVGKGTGLGLATVYGIVKQSNGFIWVHSEVGSGTSFEIYLPSCKRTGVNTAEDIPRETVRGGNETILIVEDESGVRELACTFLAAGGYTVLSAEDGNQALKIAADPTQVIDLVLTDLIMPKMNGNQLVEKLQAARPDLEVMYMTGYAEFPSAQLEQQLGRTNLLQKPFSRSSLLERVRDVLTAKKRRVSRTTEGIAR